ncbi:MAG: hypothetical protein LBJ71_05475, partial [Holosporaceae bacterium]|nr:hypothetical protein [Holosporaceae bacterium]
MTKNFLPEILLLTYIMAALITPKARSFSISWIFAAAILACFSEEESTKSTFFYQKHSIMLLKIMPLFSGIMISHLMKSEEFEKQLLL